MYAYTLKYMCAHMYSACICCTCTGGHRCRCRRLCSVHCSVHVNVHVGVYVQVNVYVYVSVILRTTKQNVQDLCLGTPYTLHTIAIVWYNILLCNYVAWWLSMCICICMHLSMHCIFYVCMYMRMYVLRTTKQNIQIRVLRLCIYI